jgi:hypothetical protein
MHVPVTHSLIHLGKEQCALDNVRAFVRRACKRHLKMYRPYSQCGLIMSQGVRVGISRETMGSMMI